MKQRKDLFNLMLKRVKETSSETGMKLPQAFSKWFIDIYFGHNESYISDGSGDGKADAFVSIRKSKANRYAILNCKFTQEYDNSSPVSFYDEITRFWQAFINKENRSEYLNNAVRQSLKNKYKEYFKLYDDGLVDLYFLTNCRINDKQHNSVKSFDVKIFHLEDILQYLSEYIEGAMPETEPLILSGITSVLNPLISETEVPTSIVFARLIDFINYMEDDPLELLFARNVRLSLGKTETNKAIETTFRKNPKEFAFSNNGITILCKTHNFDPGKNELHLKNPRVVNGSQTLHSIRNVESPSPIARVMVRIIEVPQESSTDIVGQKQKRLDIIHKISIRSNMQNPIKRWNLVSNDDYQTELSQCFWKKKYFYERRQNEWKERKDDLKSIGIKLGPDIKWMMQLISSYYFDKSDLGPADAQGRLNVLFDEKPYAIIRNTSPEVVYRIFLLGEFYHYYMRQLSNQKKYIGDVSGYLKFTLFSILCKLITKIDKDAFKKSEFETLLENKLLITESYDSKLIKALIDCIIGEYKKYEKLSNKENIRLTPANFFKNESYVNKILKKPLSVTLTSIGRKVFKYPR